ncbi:MAG: O-antigen ligase family protein [Chloroflexi bacterium]|nr:O-antigen ligase family protein [Chloroflexota bacterium]
MGMTRVQAAVLVLLLLGLAVTVAVAARYDVLVALPAGVFVLFALAAALRWPSLLAYLYAASIPLNFVTPPGPGGTVARVVGIIFVVGYLLRRLRVLRPGVVPLPMWLFLGWLLASSLWAIDPRVAFDSWLSLAQLAAVTMLIASIVAADPTEIDRILFAYSISATATAVVGVVTYLQSPTIFLTRAAAFELQGPAQFSSALIPALLYLAYRSTSGGTTLPVRVLSAAGALSCVAAVALSGTRSAWLALVVAGVVWVALRPSRRLIVGLSTVATAVVVLAVLVPGVGDFLLDRAGSATESGGAGRNDIWYVGLTVFSSSPIVGVGFGNFPLGFTQQAIDLSPVSVLGADVFVGRGSHNILLGSLVETGVIGAALLVATMLTALTRPGRDGVGTIVVVTLVGLLVQSLLLDILLQKQLWLLVAFGLGLAAARRDELHERLSHLVAGPRAPLLLNGGRSRVPRALS